MPIELDRRITDKSKKSKEEKKVAKELEKRKKVFMDVKKMSNIDI